jgi:hypothetical protein
MIADRAFANRVLDRLAEEDRRHRRRNHLRNLIPIGVIALVAGTWSIALFDGLIAMRLLIDVIAWVAAVGALEQRIGSAFLGSFAPLPLIVSTLFFFAALGWVRSHQPDVPPSKV